MCIPDTVWHSDFTSRLIPTPARQVSEVIDFIELSFQLWEWSRYEYIEKYIILPYPSKEHMLLLT